MRHEGCVVAAIVSRNLPRQVEGWSMKKVLQREEMSISKAIYTRDSLIRLQDLNNSHLY
jgi:hypothetical protein